MNDTMWSICSEWDIGHEGGLYRTKDAALKAAREMYELQEMEYSWEEVVQDGLVSVFEQKVLG